MKAKIIIAILGITTILGGLGTYDNAKKYDDLKSNILNQENVVATLWQQDSAEVKALRIQAYQTARENIDQLIEKNNMPVNPAVVLDIDETILDNIPAGAYQITSNRGYNPEDFQEWTKSGNCTEIQGASQFINYAQSKGVKIYLVSNRTQGEKEATIENLKKVGINVAPENIMLKDDTSNKEKRFDEIKKNNTIIMYIGDNASDFGGDYYKKSNEERSKLVMENANEIGVKYIILPNPTYGDFDSAIYNYNFKMTDDEKIKIRNDALKPFKQ